MKWVLDDGGRGAAGFKMGKRGDCVARAIVIAGELPYAEVWQALANGMGTQRITKRTHAKYRDRKFSADAGVYTTRKWFKDYMRSLGFEWTPTMRIGSGCKVHLHDGELPPGRLVVSLSRHYTAVVDGVIHDTYDPQRENVWIEYMRTPRPLRRGEVLVPRALVENGVEIPGVRTIQRRCVYGYWRKVVQK